MIKLRFFLLTVAFFPAVTMCFLFGVPGFLKSVAELDIVSAAISVSFVSCIAIYVLFVKDTLKMLKK
jgi:hypothetical protein